MAEVEIIKLKIRRGTDVQRQNIVLAQAEPGFTTDTNRLWIGDGSTPGGVVAGNIILPPSTNNNRRVSATRATVGDIAYDNGRLYRLNTTDPTQSSSWSPIDSKLNSSNFQYNNNNEISLKTGSITKSYLSANIVKTSGGINFSNADGLSINPDGTTINTNGGTVSVGTISQSNISSGTFGNGITGGSGTVVSLDVTSNFEFFGGALAITSLPVNVVNPSSIDISSTFGYGLSEVGGKVAADIRDTGTGISLDGVTGTISLQTLPAISSGIFSTIQSDSYGRLVSTTNTLGDSLSASSSLSSPLSVFNGSPEQDTLTDQSVFDVTDGSSTISLSSAGFIQVDAGGSIGIISIPVFKS